METERAFLQRRIVEERLAAMNASDPNARDAHLDLCRLHEVRLRALDEGAALAEAETIAGRL